MQLSPISAAVSTERLSSPSTSCGMTCASTEAEMYDEVLNEFQRNSYEHKITFYLRENSQLYLPDDYYVGRKCQVETKTGVKESLITAIERESSSGVRKITMGKLKVTLTSKLRGAI